MGQWYRIFGRSEATPDPARLLERLREVAPAVAGSFAADGGGWFRAELAVGAGEPVCLERFLAEEEGIRAELNTWAAYLETCEHSPGHAALMERAIQSRQLFTLRRPAERAGEAEVERLCLAACHFLAAATEGFYQVDGQGFFEADGTLVVPEA
jgi:hypothetical protein